MLRPDYRSYELPWSADPELETRFRRLWIGLLLICLAAGGLITRVQLPERTASVQTTVPERFARLVIERELPPPPPPPQPVETQTPQPTRETAPPREPPSRERSRERAARAGLLAFQDELADLRQQLEETREQLAPVEQITAAAGPARAERALITSRLGASSGGIGQGARSRGFGAAAGSLGEHETTRVSAPVGEGAERADRGERSGRAGRSREEIELVFDRNKGAIYALYSRALRERPDLQGKLVLEFTIAPSGEVTMCRVVSSELRDPELERRIVARVRMFRFEPRDVEAVTTTKPIDFFPA